jgi:2-haloacid dehalogenase
MSFQPTEIETITADSYGTLVDPSAAERAVAEYIDDPGPLLSDWRAKYLSYVMIANDVNDYRPFDELIEAALEQALGAYAIETTAQEREGILSVFDELDRLGRSFADLAGFVENLGEKGVDIDLVNQPIGIVGEDDWIAEMISI